MISKRVGMISKWFYVLSLCGGLPLVGCVAAGSDKGGSEADTTEKLGTLSGAEESAAVNLKAGVEVAQRTEFKAAEVVRSERSVAHFPTIAPELRLVPNHEATLSKAVAIEPGTARSNETEEGSVSMSLQK